MTDEERKYVLRIYHNALNAVVETDGDGAGGGFVQPVHAMHGLCMAIAELALQDGRAATPAARRERAEKCRRMILLAMKEMAEGGPEMTRLVSRRIETDR